MAILIDTQALVWFGTGDARLSASARNALSVGSEPLFVSAVTAFEFIDLNVRKRFDADLPLADILAALTAKLIDFPADCAALVERLPPIHRDPVDRMLVAHAIHADMTLISADADIRRYPVRTLW